MQTNGAAGLALGRIEKRKRYDLALKVSKYSRDIEADFGAGSILYL